MTQGGDDGEHEPIDDALPLAGLLVLDASTYIAGPAAATALGDWGADVIKIEAPGIGDPHRHNWRGANYTRAPANFPWQLDGRNKRSIAMDLKHDDARTALDRLLARADVLVVNFPPAVRERLRLRWEDVRDTNPRLIYASLTGYGETGPDANTPGFDANAYFARSGILDAFRYDGQAPNFSLSAQGDRPTAMTLLAAIMLGLYRRERTGKGGWVGTSLYANGVWSNASLAAAALLGALPEPRPPRERPRSAFLNHYTASDGRWFTLLLSQEQKRWPALCAAIERPALEQDPRFASSALRSENAEALVAELDRAFAVRDWPHWQARLVEAGVAVAPIARIDEVVADPQARHAGIIIDTESADVPRSIAHPVRLGFARPRSAGAPPALGQHTDAVLNELGYDEAQILALRAAGAVS